MAYSSVRCAEGAESSPEVDGDFYREGSGINALPFFFFLFIKLVFQSSKSVIAIPARIIIANA